MAIYEYYCPRCNEYFEQQRPMKESGEPANSTKCNEECNRAVSVFSSTAGNNIKTPDKGAFRGNIDKT
jgi:putative FmdB family regulatory protein